MNGLEGLAVLKSRPDSSAATLEDVASDLLKLTSDRGLAKEQFKALVRAQPLLTAQLFDERTVDAAAERWFAGFARSAEGKGAAGLDLPHGQRRHAAPEPISAGGPRPHASNGQAMTAPNAEPHDDGGGHSQGALDHGRSPDAAAIVTQKPDGDGPTFGALTAKDVLPLSARPQSQASTTAAARAASHISRTVFDSFKVRDGRAIGDVLMGEVERLRSASAQEASVLRQIQRSCVAADPNTPIRDALKVHQMERFIQTGAEVADAA